MEADATASKERLKHRALKRTGTKKVPQIPEAGIIGCPRVAAEHLPALVLCRSHSDSPEAD